MNVVLNSGVTSIGGYSFYLCRELTSITIPEGVKIIGYGAFRECKSLTSVSIPEGVTSIGALAFYDCNNLVSIIIPEEVTSVGNSAFSGCSSLASIIIPERVTSIGEGILSNCSNIKDISVAKENAYYCSDERGVLYDKNKTVLMQYPVGNLSSDYVIPGGVTSIGDNAFFGCSSLASITIPESVKKIGNRAFSGCSSLTSVIIPEGIERIENSLFFACSSLKNIIIPKSVTSIEDNAFSGCSSLASITIPESVTDIGYGTFYECSSLVSISVAKENAYYSTDENGVLYNKDETTIILYPAGRISASFTIPYGVVSVGEYAFFKCSNLVSVTIPVSVISIESNSFYESNNLTDVYYEGMSEQWKEVNIKSNNEVLTNAAVHCLEAEIKDIKLEAYKNKFKPDEEFTIVATLTPSTLSKKMIAWKTSDETVATVTGGTVKVKAPGYATITATVGKIIASYEIEVTASGNCGYTATWNLDANGTLSINGEGYMEYWGHYDTDVPWHDYRKKIKNIVIQKGIKDIGRYAFFGCNNITNVVIPEGVKSIDSGAFVGCRNLKSITIPNSVTSIAQYTFYNCNSLRDIIYIGTAEEWNKIEIGSSNEPLKNATIHFECDIEENTVSVTDDLQITLTGDISIGKVYAALYRGKKLQEIKEYTPVKAFNAAFTDKKAGDTVKIMWWNENMTPICNEASIEI